MIPRHLHAIWFGGSIPDAYSAFLDRWVDLHPDWEFSLWTEENVPPLINQGLFDDAEEIVPDHAVGQFRSDLARFEILATHGGVYVDVDLEPLAPIDALLGPSWLGTRDAMIAHETPLILNTAFVGAAPGHPLVMQAIPEIVRRARRHLGKTASVISVPKMITPIAFDLAEKGRVALLPTELVYPYPYDALDRAGETYPDAFMVHHWNHQRELKERPLDRAHTSPSP